MRTITWQLFSGTHVGKHRHSLGVRATDGFYPQRCHLSPATTNDYKRIPLAWWCSPLAPEPAYLSVPFSVLSLLWMTCAGRQVFVAFLILQGVAHYR